MYFFLTQKHVYNFSFTDFMLTPFTLLFKGQTKKVRVIYSHYQLKKIIIIKPSVYVLLANLNRLCEPLHGYNLILLYFCLMNSRSQLIRFFLNCRQFNFCNVKWFVKRFLKFVIGLICVHLISVRFNIKQVFYQISIFLMDIRTFKLCFIYQ